MEEINSVPNIPTPSETSTNPPVKSLFPSKSILIVLLVFLIILSFLVAYFLVKPQTASQIPLPTPKNQPSVQTKEKKEIMSGPGVYKNATFGYSLQIPDQYVVSYSDAYIDNDWNKGKVKNNDSEIKIFNPKTFTEIGETPSLQIDVYRNTKNLSLNDWILQHPSNTDNFTSEEVFGKENTQYAFYSIYFAGELVKNEIVNGQNFLYDEYHPLVKGITVRTSFLQSGEYIFQFTYFVKGLNGEYPELRNIFSSFQFEK